MQQAAQFPEVVPALGEIPRFRRGDRVRIALRSPVGHYRVPLYVRGRTGTIETIIVPTALDNEEEGFGRNAGSRRHYYRIAIPLRELWPEYAGALADGLRIEVFETWLEEA